MKFAPKFRIKKVSTIIYTFFAVYALCFLAGPEVVSSWEKSNIKKQNKALNKEIKQLQATFPEEFEEYYSMFSDIVKMRACLQDTVSYDCAKDTCICGVEDWLKKNGLAIGGLITDGEGLEDLLDPCIFFETAKFSIMLQMFTLYDLMEDDEYEFIHRFYKRIMPGLYKPPYDQRIDFEKDVIIKGEWKPRQEQSYKPMQKNFQNKQMAVRNMRTNFIRSGRRHG